MSLTEAELATGVQALTPIAGELLADPETETPPPLEQVLLLAEAFAKQLDAAGYVIREHPPLPPGTARAELIIANRLMEFGPDGRLRLDGPPAGSGPGAFVLAPTPEGGRLWIGVTLQPGRVYELKPEALVWTPPAPGSGRPS